MFTGMTFTTVLADALDVAVEFVVPIGIYAAFWAGRRLLGSSKGFFRR